MNVADSELEMSFNKPDRILGPNADFNLGDMTRLCSLMTSEQIRALDEVNKIRAVEIAMELVKPVLVPLLASSNVEVIKSYYLAMPDGKGFEISNISSLVKRQIISKLASFQLSVNDLVRLNPITSVEEN